MPRTILYYPTIDVPNGDWLNKALLYWDHISSIVPESYNFRPTYLIQELADEGIYKPTFPSKLFYSPNFQSFENEVISALKSKIGSKYSTSGDAYTNCVHKEKLYWPDLSTAIYYKKIPNKLHEFMKEHNLIEVFPNGDWITMEKNAASIYMSVLAEHLACIADTPTVLGTDKNKFLYSAYSRKYPNSKYFCFSICLDKVLPTPVPGTPVKKIIDFKKKRRSDLLRFQKSITDFENQIASCSCFEEITQTVSDFKDSIELSIIDQQRQMYDERIDCVFGTLKTLCSTSVPGIVTSISEAVGATPSWLTVTTLGIGGLIGVGCNFVKHNRSIHQINMNSGFAYMYEATKKNIINPTHYTKIV